MGRVLIVHGAERYADDWHPFAETAQEVAALLRPAHDVEVTGDVARRLAEPGEPDLVVVDIGNPGDPDPDEEQRIVDGLRVHLAAGRSLLALHVSITSLTTAPDWEAITGARWVRGTTMHPPYGPGDIRLGSPSPLTAGLADFAVEDELYTNVRIAPDVDPLLVHVRDGARHPLLWTREHAGGGVAVDLLGHDATSYRSPEHAEILRRVADDLIERPRRA